jgi:hypothetical protein
VISLTASSKIAKEPLRIARMKINALISVIMISKRWLGAVAVVLVVMALAQAQVTTVKRITSFQLGDATEGARVTVVSDSALNDYEAFRRGDRFYVKIPVARSVPAQPRFRGDGFDDVQVQQAGDGLVVSFKLQPGASAHVNQRSNRLDVIFSAPNRIARNNSLMNRETSDETSAMGPADTSAIGPLPPNSPFAARRGSVAKAGNSGSNVINDPAKANTAQANSSAPMPVVSPATSTEYASSIVTPTPADAAGSTRGSGLATWKGRAQQWVSANRRPVTAGGLLLLLGAFAALLLRRREVVKTKRAKGPLAQP